MRPIIKTILALSFILIHPVLSSSDEGHNGEKIDFFLEGKELSAMVNINGGIYLSQGHPVGFHFDLLNRFAKHQKCNIKIAPSQEKDHWNSLMDGTTDILVVDAAGDSIPDQYADKVISSLYLNDKEHVWVVKKENYNMLQSMNYWFGYYSHTREFRNMQNKYYRMYRRNTFTNGPVSVLSPYDQIIKQYARSIGWDWRLLASLIYQESKFRISAKSGRDAHGLMQILPSTAKKFDIVDLYDPEQNIKAGTLFIKRLISLYNSHEIDSVNRVKFILAAYNAGEGRVEDIRRAADYKKINRFEWDSLKQVIPYMSIHGELPEELLRHGKFKGTETINFVDEILNRYENYKMLVKK